MTDRRTLDLKDPSLLTDRAFVGRPVDRRS